MIWYHASRIPTTIGLQGPNTMYQEFWHRLAYKDSNAKHNKIHHNSANNQLKDEIQYVKGRFFRATQQANGNLTCLNPLTMKLSLNLRKLIRTLISFEVSWMRLKVKWGRECVWARLRKRKGRERWSCRQSEEEREDGFLFFKSYYCMKLNLLK